MFGGLGKFVDKLTEGIIRRGQGLVDAADHVTEERRSAVRAVRNALSEAMANAEDDREHGARDAGHKALMAANHAASVAHEIADDEARRLVLDWKAKFDASPQGYKNSDYGVRGYPEPGWMQLRAARDAALDRLGAVLRELMESGRK